MTRKEKQMLDRMSERELLAVLAAVADDVALVSLRLRALRRKKSRQRAFLRRQEFPDSESNQN